MGFELKVHIRILVEQRTIVNCARYLLSRLCYTSTSDFVRDLSRALDHSRMLVQKRIKRLFGETACDWYSSVNCDVAVNNSVLHMYSDRHQPTHFISHTTASTISVGSIEDHIALEWRPTLHRGAFLQYPLRTAHSPPTYNISPSPNHCLSERWQTNI